MPASAVGPGSKQGAEFLSVGFRVKGLGFQGLRVQGLKVLNFCHESYE